MKVQGIGIGIVKDKHMAQVFCPANVYKDVNHRRWHIATTITGIPEDLRLKTACGLTLIGTQKVMLQKIPLERVRAEDLCANCFRGFTVENNADMESNNGD